VQTRRPRGRIPTSIREHGPVLVPALCSGRLERQCGRSRIEDTAPGVAAIRARLPLHGGRRKAPGCGSEGDFRALADRL
jgi:hypothetical protein